MHIREHWRTKVWRATQSARTSLLAKIPANREKNRESDQNRVVSARSCRCKRSTINALLAKFPTTKTGKIFDPNRERTPANLSENAEIVRGIYRPQSIKRDREKTSAEYFISGGKFEPTAYAYKFPAPKFRSFRVAENIVRRCAEAAFRSGTRRAAKKRPFDAGRAILWISSPYRPFHPSPCHRHQAWLPPFPSWAPRRSWPRW